MHGALQVEQTPWCGDHQIGVLQFGNLQLVRHAAHHVGHAQAAAVFDQVDRIVGHLLGQLACRANNQGARRRGFEVAGVGGVFALAAFGQRLAFGCSLGAGAVKRGALLSFLVGHFLEQGVQYRQQESRCFAAAGLA